MNSKMTTNLKLSTTEPKNQKLNKQLEQEQNQRNGDHMEGFQWGGRGEECGGKVRGIRSTSDKHEIDREVRIV